MDPKLVPTEQWVTVYEHALTNDLHELVAYVSAVCPEAVAEYRAMFEDEAVA